MAHPPPGTVEDPQPAPSGPQPNADLLDRPHALRVQEFKYRFGQSVVFGLPVVALEGFGRSLGGPESDRWVTLFQALLSGWVVYVGAAGMLAEGGLLLLARRRLPTDLLGDLCVAVLTLLLYLAGLPRLVEVLVGYGPAGRWPAGFAVCVAVLAAWSGVRWAVEKKKLGRSTRPSSTKDR